MKCSQLHGCFFFPPSRSPFLMFTGAFCFVLMFYSVSDDFVPRFLHNSALHVTGDLFLRFRDNTTIPADRNAIVLGFDAGIPAQVRFFCPSLIIFASQSFSWMQTPITPSWWIVKFVIVSLQSISSSTHSFEVILRPRPISPQAGAWYGAQIEWEKPSFVPFVITGHARWNLSQIHWI